MRKLRDAVNEFFTETSVHGLKYLSFGYNLCEKFLWALFVSLGIFGAGSLVYQTIQDSYNHPILTTMDSVPITEYPFPAITVDSGRSFFHHQRN